MYVLVMDNGYAVFSESEGRFIVEDFKEVSKETVSVEINGKKTKLHILPTGGICISVFNEKWDTYKKNGGKAKAPRKGIKLGDSRSLRIPRIIFPAAEKKATHSKALNFNDFTDSLKTDASFKKVWFTEINGKPVTVFEVEQLSELYSFDYQRAYPNRAKVKYCPECGHAFFQHGKAVVCDACRANGAIEKRKYENMMNDPDRKKLHQIKQRNAPNKRQTSPNNGGKTEYILYENYYNDLCNFIDVNRTQPGFADRLDRLDKDYFKLCKYINNNLDYMDEKQIFEWAKDRENFLKADSPEEWLAEWIKRTGMQM